MGGLFTGIELERAGHDATVYERSTGELRHRGAGIVAQENVRRFLDRHAVVDPDAITTTSSERRFLTRDGDVQAARPESMVFTAWDAVYRRLREAFPDDAYRAGAEVVDVDPETPAVAVSDRSETAEAERRDRAADLIVVAEGGQSASRRRLFPDADVEPAFADYVAWRGVVPESDLSSDVVAEFDGRFTFYQGPNLFVLAYLIPGADGETEPGERRLNWVWYDTLADRDRTAIFTDASGVEREVTVPPGRLREPVRRRQFERAAETLPPVFETVVTETDAPFVQAIYDLTAPEMVVERACLLGDAAFVARPHTAAGTAKAAGDAVELASALEEHKSLDAALRSWNDARTDYGSRLVERGKRMGDERLGLATQPR